MFETILLRLWSSPIGSMYGIFTYSWLIFMVNVGQANIPVPWIRHGSEFHEKILKITSLLPLSFWQPKHRHSALKCTAHLRRPALKCTAHSWDCTLNIMAGDGEKLVASSWFARCSHHQSEWRCIFFTNPDFTVIAKGDSLKKTTILVGGQWCFPSRVLCSQCESSVVFRSW